MPDLCRIVDFLPLKWRYASVVAVPLTVGFALYGFFGIAAVAVGATVAIVVVWFLANRQSQFFWRTANGILRTQSIDRSNRLTTYGPPEQQRIVNAVNRLADSVESILAESDLNRAYHETILNELMIGILVVDENGMLQYANPAVCATLDFTYDEVGNGLTTLASKVNVYEINEAATTSATVGETVVLNLEIYDSQRHLEVISRSLPTDDSGARRAIVIINDRTDEIRLGVSMREFVANASHELRTPIASIQASVDTLKMGAALKTDAAAEFLDRIDDSSQRMAALVSEMMDLTMLETGRSPLNVELIALSPLIDGVFDAYGPLELEPIHQYELAVDEGLPQISVDRAKIERAIGNLLGNAKKFTPPGGRIRLSGRVDDGFVAITVQDNGEGIDPDELPYIFERFYKSPRSSGDRTGFGLGLAITKNIVEMHRGSVEAESVVGEGSKFTVRLPIP